MGDSETTSLRPTLPPYRCQHRGGGKIQQNYKKRGGTPQNPTLPTSESGGKKQQNYKKKGATPQNPTLSTSESGVCLFITKEVSQIFFNQGSLRPNYSKIMEPGHLLARCLKNMKPRHLCARIHKRYVFEASKLPRPRGTPS